jgi:hypothetical protein
MHLSVGRPASAGPAFWSQILGYRRQDSPFTLPDLMPVPPQPKGAEPGTAFDGARMEDGEERRPVPVGRDETLNFLLNQETPAGGSRTIRFKIRFLTPDEVEAALK